MSGPYQNLLLRYLDVEAVTRLQLRRDDLPVGMKLQEPDERIRRVYFLEDGAAFLTLPFQDGTQVEVALFGCEAMIGVSAMMGMNTALSPVSMHIGGYGYSTTVELARGEFQRNQKFASLVMRYLQANLIQTSQNAACNARHDVATRMARWLLMCQDRVKSDVLPLTQEFMATMLGVERPAVNMAAVELQKAGLIQYTRGKVQVLNRAGLEAVSCECYRAVSEYLQKYAVIDKGMG